jgi:hypothetical protein
MLNNILSSLTPEVIAQTIQKNPILVPTVLQKFEAYIAFGQALSVEQQLHISKNIGSLGSFFRSDVGKTSIGLLADEFIKFSSK